MSYEIDDNYIDVPARIAEFRAKYPTGSLQPVDPLRPYTIERIPAIDGDGNEFLRTFVVYAAAAYRYPGDPLPGIGTAYEPFPGRTPYTRDSELQNAETAAWGRAIVASLAADTKKGVSSADEVRNRRADQEEAAGPRTGEAQQAPASSRRSRPKQQSTAEASDPVAEAKPADPPADDSTPPAVPPKEEQDRSLIAQIVEAGRALGFRSGNEVADDYAASHGGQIIREATNADLAAYLAELNARAAAK